MCPHCMRSHILCPYHGLDSHLPDYYYRPRPTSKSVEQVFAPLRKAMDRAAIEYGRKHMEI